MVTIMIKKTCKSTKNMITTIRNTREGNKRDQDKEGDDHN